MTQAKLLAPQELADFLGVPLGTLYQWRSRGGGPRGIRIGKHLRYRQADVDAFLDANTKERSDG